MNETILILPLTVFLIGIIASFVIFMVSEREESKKKCV